MAASQTQSAPREAPRVAVVAGLRTPFARQLTAFTGVNGIQLGTMVTSELMARMDLDPGLVERLVYGQVVILPEAPNVAREVALAAGLPGTTDAYSVSRACATSFQAAADVAGAIRCGDIQIGLAGGTDSASVLPIQFSRPLSDAFIKAGRARGMGAKLKAFRGIRPRHLAPRPPAIRDYSTNLGMGEIAEQMAKNHGIGREQQDRFAVRSHQRAHQAWEDGLLDDEVMTGFAPPYQREPISRDNTIRADSTETDLAKLRPAFDRRHGTVTAANSTPLTDGAATLVLMAEDRARELGYEPLGFIRSSAFTATDPFNDALMGPSHATPLALDRAGVRLADMDLVDMHEAFAAQTLANISKWPSKRFARDVLGRDEPIGEIDWERFNVLGGSIAYGHPFAATGARIITQTLRELRRRGGHLALTTACAAGGLGAAMVLEAA